VATIYVNGFKIIKCDNRNVNTSVPMNDKNTGENIQSSMNVAKGK